jgi:antitoxin ParD1/3/4
LKFRGILALLEDATMPRTVDDQVPREGIRLIEEREGRLASLDAAIAKGIEAAKAGDARPSSEVFARLEAKYRALAESAR